jgi:hypothetical protein
LDAALGNGGGDPHGYYVFNRDNDLAAAKLAHEACSSAVFAFAQ